MRKIFTVGMPIAAAMLGIAGAKPFLRRKEPPADPQPDPRVAYRIEVWKTNRWEYRWHEGHRQWLERDLPDGWAPSSTMLLWGKGDGSGGQNRLREGYARSQELIAKGRPYLQTLTEEGGRELLAIIRRELPEKVRLVKVTTEVEEV